MRFSARLLDKNGYPIRFLRKTWSPWKARRFLDAALVEMMASESRAYEVIVWLGSSVLYRTTADQYQAFLRREHAQWN